MAIEVGGWVSPAAAAAAAAAAADPRAAAVNADKGVGGKPILPWLLGKEISNLEYKLTHSSFLNPFTKKAVENLRFILLKRMRILIF